MTEAVYNFEAIFGSWRLDVYAEHDVETGDILDLAVGDDRDPIPNVFVKIRREDGDPINLLPRRNDARILSSRVDWDRGTVETVTQLSDMYLPLHALVQAAAGIAIDNNKSFINLQDRLVVAHAIKNITGV